MADKQINTGLIIDGIVKYKGVDISSALSTNQSYTGTFEVATVGESVAFGDVLYLKFSDGKY
jgi:hypothetical protein